MERRDDRENGDESVETVSRFRTALPQVLASTAKNLILVDIGMAMAFPTIIIPVVHNAVGDLSLDDSQTSWLGSLLYICQPLGSILSGFILEPIGRKKSMIIVNLPQLVAWLMLYWADSVTMLYAASIIMGLGVGFMEAPILTYVGEITQPQLRGMLTSYAGICAQLGFLFEYLLGTVLDWRSVAIYSAIIPVLTAIAITQVPESPMWLLARGRVDEAEASLRWLRGWVPSLNVRQEFMQLVHYQETARKDQQRRKLSDGSSRRPSSDEARFRASGLHERHRGSQNWPVAIVPPNKEADSASAATDDETGCLGTKTTCLRKAVDVLQPETLSPLLLVISLFFFHAASGMAGIRSYMVEVVEEFGMPIDAHWATVVSAALSVAANVLLLILVPFSGKRPLLLLSLTGCALSCLLLGGYALAFVPEVEGSVAIGTWAPLTLFIILSFFTSFGVAPIPWMLISEVFPFRTRSLASGMAAASAYILNFVAAKTFLNLKFGLGLWGVFFLYGIITVVGVTITAWKVPETEGKTLEAIESLYNPSRKRSLGTVLANVATLTEIPVLIGVKPITNTNAETSMDTLNSETTNGDKTQTHKNDDHSTITQTLSTSMDTSITTDDLGSIMYDSRDDINK